MKKLTNNKDFHILQGPAVKLQKNLDMMAQRYDVTVHAVNIVANGDAVIVVERKRREIIPKKTLDKLSNPTL